jgi:hypothetical protein
VQVLGHPHQLQEAAGSFIRNQGEVVAQLTRGGGDQAKSRRVDELDSSRVEDDKMPLETRGGDALAGTPDTRKVEFTREADDDSIIAENGLYPEVIHAAPR